MEDRAVLRPRGLFMSRSMTAPVLALYALLLAGVAIAADAPPPALPDLAVIHTALVGTWQSQNDTKLTREFDADGRTVERYEGDDSATNIGRWALFYGKSPPPGFSGQKFEDKVVYLKIDQNGDVLLFALAGLTRSDMKMVYLERGNVMSFARLD